MDSISFAVDLDDDEGFWVGSAIANRSGPRYEVGLKSS